MRPLPGSLRGVVMAKLIPQHVLLAGALALSSLIAASCPATALAQATSSASPLSGSVASKEEGPMEGVLVSAQRAGSPITITVVSDAKGRFRFLEGKLAPGRYAIRVRAIGYDL